MKHSVALGVLFFSLCYADSYTDLFVKQSRPLKGERIVTDPYELARVAQEGADFLSKLHKSKYSTASAGLFQEFGVTLDQVQETLQFIAQVGKTRPDLLTSPWFLNTHFTFYRWYGDKTKQKEYIPRGWKAAPEHILTTRYRITQVPASRVKTKYYNVPLCELPEDEKQFTSAQKKEHKESLLRFKHSYSAIVGGALEKNKKTRPLAWVTQKGCKEFVMQGSVLARYPDGTKKLLRVAGSNGMTSPDNYWYAMEVAKRPKNSAFPVKVKPRAGVTYAGDMNLLGFGKVIVLVGLNPVSQEEETRLGVLVDTGGAFKDNLSKLDLFTGYFEDEQAFKKHSQTYPHTARAYILIKKSPKVAS